MFSKWSPYGIMFCSGPIVMPSFNIKSKLSAEKLDGKTFDDTVF